MMTYFDCCKVPVIAKGIDMLEEGKIKNMTNLEFANTIMSSVLKQYAHYTDDEVFKINDYGKFFPAVVRDPHTYFQY